MRRYAVYNLAIPIIIPNQETRASRSAASLRRVAQISFVIVGLAISARAADWNGPEQQLARKIVAVTGPGNVALKLENRSSLGRRDSEVIQNGLRSALEAIGLRAVKVEPAATTVTISLSENPTSYVWVAQILKGGGLATVVMVSTPRPEGAIASRDSVPLSLRKSSLWTQIDRIVDLAVLEEGTTPTHIAVLGEEKLVLYRWQGGKWTEEQELGINHSRPWPRDLRGRLLPARDHLLDVYLPGIMCRSTAAVPLTLSCRESDDPWPLVSGRLNRATLSVFPSTGLANGASTVVPQLGAFYASTRNFFTGALTPGVGKFTTVPKFYSAAVLPRETSALWLFLATDGLAHIVDGDSDRTGRWGWGSDLASVKTPCGAGWQVLAASPGDQGEDSVRAYEFPDHDPVAVSAPLDLPGTITALWTEAGGDTAVVVVRNRETGSYEAFRLALACSQ